MTHINNLSTQDAKHYKYDTRNKMDNAPLETMPYDTPKAEMIDDNTSNDSTEAENVSLQQDKAEDKDNEVGMHNQAFTIETTAGEEAHTTNMTNELLKNVTEDVSDTLGIPLTYQPHITRKIKNAPITEERPIQHYTQLYTFLNILVSYTHRGRLIKPLGFTCRTLYKCFDSMRCLCVCNDHCQTYAFYHVQNIQELMDKFHLEEKLLENMKLTVKQNRTIVIRFTSHNRLKLILHLERYVQFKIQDATKITILVRKATDKKCIAELNIANILQNHECKILELHNIKYAIYPLTINGEERTSLIHLLTNTN